MLGHRRVEVRRMVWAALLVALLGAGNFAAAHTRVHARPGGEPDAAGDRIAFVAERSIVIAQSFLKKVSILIQGRSTRKK